MTPGVAPVPQGAGQGGSGEAVMFVVTTAWLTIAPVLQRRMMPASKNLLTLIRQVFSLNHARYLIPLNLLSNSHTVDEVNGGLML